MIICKWCYCKVEGFRKYSKTQPRKGRPQSYRGKAHSAELQSSSGINRRTKTVRWELHDMAFHGWASAVVMCWWSSTFFIEATCSSCNKTTWQKKTKTFVRCQAIMSLMAILLLGRPTSFLFFVSLFVSIFVPSSSVSTLTIDDVTSKLRPTWLSYDCIHLLIMFLMFFIFKTGAKIALTSTFLKIHQDYIIYCHHLDSLQYLLFPHIKQHCCSTFWHSLFQNEPNKSLRELCQSLHSICAHVGFSVLQTLHFKLCQLYSQPYQDNLKILNCSIKSYSSATPRLNITAGLLQR